MYFNQTIPNLLKSFSISFNSFVLTLALVELHEEDVVVRSLSQERFRYLGSDELFECRLAILGIIDKRL